MLLCLGTTPAVRRYTTRFLSAMVAYSVLTIAVAVCVRRIHVGGALAYILSVLPAIPITLGIAAVGVYLKEEKDEFERMVFVQSLLWGLGALLVLTSTWGLLESFTRAPHLQPMWVLPLFCFFYPVAMVFVRRSYR